MSKFKEYLNEERAPKTPKGKKLLQVFLDYGHRMENAGILSQSYPGPGFSYMQAQKLDTEFRKLLDELKL